MQPVSLSSSRLAALPQHPALWRGSDLARVSVPGTPSGFAALDAQLPGGGWPAACLTEIMTAHEGIGELRLLAPALARLSNAARPIAWVAPPHLPYAPALAAAGIDIARLLIVRTRRGREGEQQTLWAAEQALRAQACGAVLVWSNTADYPALRRLQLAAEGGRAPAFVFRPVQAAGAASPAALRLRLDSAEGGLAVRIVKRRGAPLAQPVLIPALTLAERNHSFSGSPHALDRASRAAAAAGNFSARHAHA